MKSSLKQCSRCKKWLSLDSFAHNRSRKDGLQHRCRDCHSACVRQSYGKHRAKRLEQGRRWYQNNQQRHNRRATKWLKAHPLVYIAKNHRYRARKRGLPVNFTAHDWQRALDYFHNACAVCGNTTRKLAADHWIPLADTDCPGTVPSNIVPLCKPCNSRKKGTPPDDWLHNTYDPDTANAILLRVFRYFKSLSRPAIRDS